MSAANRKTTNNRSGAARDSASRRTSSHPGELPDPHHPGKAPSTAAMADGSHRVEHLPPSRLKPHPSNPRTHSRKQIQQVAASIARFGFNAVVVINGDGMILVGHARAAAAKLIGLQTVPCIRVGHLTAAEERAYLLADNKLALNSGWDTALLADVLAELSIELPTLEVPLDVTVTGFDPGEIDAVLTDHEEEPRDPADDLPDTPSSGIVTRSGDLWLLGRHRLLCGDARAACSYVTLMEGELAAQAITDPPWNVRVNGHVGGRGRRKFEEFVLASGEMSDSEFEDFLQTSIGSMTMSVRAGGLIYVFSDWRHIEMVCRVGRGLDLQLINLCVWNKPSPGQGSLYRSTHELICVFRKPGGSTANNVALGRYGRSRTNVWTFASPNKFAKVDDLLAKHPTPKPVAMIAEAIKDSSRRGEIILDPFHGSGTLIMAAEKVGRRGYAMELEPSYVDLAIWRWKEFSHNDAILASTGQTFEEVAAERLATTGSGSAGGDE